jgi:hypothetical protein
MTIILMIGISLSIMNRSSEMYGNNSIYNISLSQTGHSLTRSLQRNVSKQDINLAQRYGSEEMVINDKKVSIDYSAYSAALEEGIDLMKLFGLTLIVTKNGILKTVYFKS